MKFITRLFILFVVLYVLLPKAYLSQYIVKKNQRACKVKYLGSPDQEMEKAEGSDEENKEEKNAEDDCKDKTIVSMAISFSPLNFHYIEVKYHFFSQSPLSVYPELTTPPPEIS